MASSSLVSALERFPVGQRPAIAHLLRAAALRVPLFSLGQMLTVWSIYAANELGGLNALRNFSGFRRKNEEKVKTVATALCERGFLQQITNAIVAPLKHCPIGGPYHVPATPVFTWQPLREEDVPRRDELQPFIRRTISTDPLVESRKWRTGDFGNRFTLHEPTSNECPRFTAYSATLETRERVEAENDDIPTRQTLKHWTMEVPIQHHYYWNDTLPGAAERNPFHSGLPFVYHYYSDIVAARDTHEYYAADIYVQLLQRDPAMASRYYYLDRGSRLRKQGYQSPGRHLNLPDAAVLANDGHVDHFKMFAGGAIRWVEEFRPEGYLNWIPTSLCQIHLRLEQHPYEL